MPKVALSDSGRDSKIFLLARRRFFFTFIHTLLPPEGPSHLERPLPMQLIHRISLRSLLLAWCCAGLLLLAPAQSETPIQDVVYLHNGSMIRGQIVAQVPGESVSIQIAEGRVFTFLQEDIAVITREGAAFQEVRVQFRRALRPVVMRSEGFYQRFSVGLGLVQGRWGVEGNAALGYHAGYIFRPRLRAGLATGFDFYGGGVILPVMAEAQADLVFKPVTPIVRVQAGYGFGIAPGWANDVFRGGLVGQVALGFRFRTRSRAEYMLTCGYKAQHTYEEFQDFPPGWVTATGQWIQPDPVSVRGTRLYQRTFIELGIGF